MIHMTSEKQGNPNWFLKDVRRLPRRLPFTLIMLAILILVALVTDTFIGPLSAAWLRRLGFAPRDFIFLRWRRLFTSALVTDGGWVFWQALALMAIACGAAEWQAGTWRAAATFWGVHLVTLAVESFLLAVPARFLGLPLATATVVARDVGPSAGYFACLGLALARLARPWGWIGRGTVMALLVLFLVLPAGVGQDPVINLVAGLAHVIAFPLGWLASSFQRWPR
jgi:hypothetical protein